MLWYKSWLETRWRFLIGLALLAVLAAGAVFNYPAVMHLMPLAGALDTDGAIGRMISEAVELQREYRGYVWYQWFRQNLAQTWTLFAILLGSGGLLSKASGGAEQFTLSLASRNHLLGVRIGTGLAELLVLALVPSLVIPLFSPAIGESYSVGHVLVHGACLFVAGTVFYSLAVLLSTVFSDLWRPLLIAFAVAMVLAVCEQFLRGLSGYGLFRVMSADVYFRSGALPWAGLFVSAVVSVSMLYAATVNFNHRDF